MSFAAQSQLLCEAIFDYNGRTETGIRHDQQAFVNRCVSPSSARDGVKACGQPRRGLAGGHDPQRRRRGPAAQVPEPPVILISNQQINGSALRKNVTAYKRPYAILHVTDDREELRKQKEQLSRLLVSLMAKVAER